jgi:hypothetical protein
MVRLAGIRRKVPSHPKTAIARRPRVATDRRLEARHRHFEIRRYQTRLELQCAGASGSSRCGSSASCPTAASCAGAKAKHDDLAAISVQMEGDRRVPLAVLKAAAETALSSAEPGEVLVVWLDGPGV